MTFIYYTPYSLKSKGRKQWLPNPNAYANIKSRKVIMPDQEKTENITPDNNAPTPEDMMKEIAGKISEVHNILIALSSDPSVDEIAAAIGLSICLDRVGKRATSIYSGKTPNALEFLKPEETFETTADVLKDFVIALNKEKADHLRYKLDGDFVKIFITPYKTRIDNDDLEFSYGDFNIEFVLALNVANGIDLDDALREHGRVMHDATVANITTGNPGKFGDIEWSDKTASSVSEMAARLIYSIGGKDALTGEEATAFLTGIVSATDHFSNAKTTATTLQIASELMKSGADRQLIADNISLESDNMFMFSSAKGFREDNTNEDSLASLNIDHNPEEDSETSSNPDSATGSESKTESESTDSASDKSEDSELLADLQAVAAGLAQGSSVTTPEATNEPLRIDAAGNEIVSEQPESPAPILEPTPTLAPTAPASSEPAPASDFAIPTAPEISAAPATPEAPEMPQAPEAPAIPEPSLATPSVLSSPETTIAPSADFTTDNLSENSNRYGQMLEDALAEANNASQTANPAASLAPSAPTEPEINGVPEINYAPASNDEILPPPPTPPIDFSSTMMPPQNNP